MDPSTSAPRRDVEDAGTGVHLLENVEVLCLSDELKGRIQAHTASERAGEQYRLIRTRVVHHPGRPRSILISSPGVGDGKTTTAIGLGWVLALRERARTLLLDGDLRRSALTREFALSGRPGLTEVLRGSCTMQEALITCAENPNLYVLGSGVHRANVTELLDTPNCQEWTETAQSVFDYIVIDAPPVAAVADYELLQRLVDGVILIARPGFTNRSSLETALASVPSELLLGVVMNFARDWPFWKAPHRYYNYAGTAE